MPSLTSKLLAYILGGAAVALAVALAYVVINKNAAIHSLTDAIHNPVTGYAARLSRAEGSLATCRGNTATLEASIDDQNAAIEQAQRQAAAVAAQSRAALAAVRQQNAALADRAESIMAAQPGENVCASAEALINSTVGE